MSEKTVKGVCYNCLEITDAEEDWNEVDILDVQMPLKSFLNEGCTHVVLCASCIKKRYKTLLEKAQKINANKDIIDEIEDLELHYSERKYEELKTILNL